MKNSDRNIWTRLKRTDRSPFHPVYDPEDFKVFLYSDSYASKREITLDYTEGSGNTAYLIGPDSFNNYNMNGCSIVFRKAQSYKLKLKEGRHWILKVEFRYNGFEINELPAVNEPFVLSIYSMHFTLLEPVYLLLYGSEFIRNQALNLLFETICNARSLYEANQWTMLESKWGILKSDYIKVVSDLNMILYQQKIPRNSKAFEKYIGLSTREYFDMVDSFKSLLSVIHRGPDISYRKRLRALRYLGFIHNESFVNP